jgi:hypothetical protein
MSMIYTWEVTGLKTKDETNADGVTLPNAVVQTYWKKIGTDTDGNEGSFSGATPFTAQSVPEGSFVEFANLTEETVLGWIQNLVIGDYETHVNQQIQKQIDDQAISEATMPWAPAPSEDSA